VRRVYLPRPVLHFPPVIRRQFSPRRLLFAGQRRQFHRALFVRLRRRVPDKRQLRRVEYPHLAPCPFLYLPLTGKIKIFGGGILEIGEIHTSIGIGKPLKGILVSGKPEKNKDNNGKKTNSESAFMLTPAFKAGFYEYI
jgi:hypothetical protein